MICGSGYDTFIIDSDPTQINRSIAIYDTIGRIVLRNSLTSAITLTGGAYNFTDNQNREHYLDSVNNIEYILYGYSMLSINAPGCSIFMDGYFRGELGITLGSLSPAPINAAPVSVDSVNSGTEDVGIFISAFDLLANATDGDSDILTIASVQDAVHGSVSMTGPSQIVFRPDADYNGPASFTYTVTDSVGGVSTSVVNLTIAPVNDAPRVQSASVNGQEDTPIVLTTADLLANATDVEGDPLTLSSVQDATHGTVTMSSQGQVVFTPDADYNGLASFTYTVSDGAGEETIATMDIDLAPVNDAPVVQNVSRNGRIDTAVVLSAADLLVNATDIDGDTLTLSSVQDAVHGSVAMDQQGQVIFTPDASYHGAASFTYTVSDGAGGISTATVNLNIKIANNAPGIQNFSASGQEDAPIVLAAVDLMGNATDPDGDTLALASVQDATHGSVALDEQGQVVFTPDANYNGAASFTFTVSDGDGGESIATVVLDITATNDAPVNQNLAASGQEDASIIFTTADLLTNATDVDGNLFTLASVQDAIHGSVLLNDQGQVLFTPDADYHGAASFTYTVSDASGATSTATVHLDLAPVNDAPTAQVVAANGQEDAAIVLSAADLLANATDIDGDMLSLLSVQNAVHGSVALNDQGQVLFTPDADHHGTASFSYTVSDASGAASTATVYLDLAPVNDAPTAQVVAANGQEDAAIVLSAADLLANATDIDGDMLSLLSVQNAVHGSVALNDQGQVLFTPDADHHGTASFSYTVSDASGAASTATVHLDLSPVNDAPTAQVVAAIGQEDAAIVLSAADLLANATDVDGDMLSLLSAQNAVHGSVVLNDLGQVIFTPDADYHGGASFTYTASDTSGAISTASVQLDLAPVNDAPTTSGDAVETLNTLPVTLTAQSLLSNDTDKDGDALSIQSVDSAVGGSVVLDGTGNVVRTPTSGFQGAGSFTYTTSDGAGGTASATVAVTVYPSVVNGTTGYDSLTGTAFGETLDGGASADVLRGMGGDDSLLGGDGADTLEGGAGADTLDGGNSRDLLIGDGGADTLGGVSGSADSLNFGNHYLGGTGNDLLRGTIDADLYRFRQGDGSDTLQEPTGASTTCMDRVLFGSGIPSAQVSVSASGTDIILTYGAGDSIRGVNWYDSFQRYGVEQIVFDDGVVWTLDQVLRMGVTWTGGDGADTRVGMAALGDLLQGGGGADALSGGGGADRLEGGSEDDVLKGEADGDWMMGGDGNDLLDGGDASDWMDGGSGNDELGVMLNGSTSEYWGNGNVLYIGGSGNDLLHGSRRGDVYYFATGDGADTIDEINSYSGGMDRILFASGVAAASVGCVRVGNDLKLNYGSGDSILITGWYSAEGRRVEEVRFAEGTLWDELQLHVAGLAGAGQSTTGATVVWAGVTLTGTSGADTLTGGSGGDVLLGGDGNDALFGGQEEETLIGGQGNDTLDGGELTDWLDGGAGDDVLGGGCGSADCNGTSGNIYVGGVGNDTLRGTYYGDLYRFSLGDGSDVIEEYNSYAVKDWIEFDVGVESGALSAMRNNQDLVLNYGTGSDSIQISNWFNGGAPYRIEGIRFADGTYWNDEQLNRLAMTTTGSGGADTLTVKGNFGGESLDGGAGDDTLTGGAWCDVLQGGDGTDALSGGTKEDLLVGGAGDDVLDGGADGDIYLGGSGNDILGGNGSSTDAYGGDGNVYRGGTGADRLNGSYYGDQYLFARGDGADDIYDPGTYTNRVDRIEFDPDIGMTDISLGKIDGNLVIHYGAGDQVTVHGWDAYPTTQMEEIQSGDGAVLLNTQVDQLIQAMATFGAEHNGISWEEATSQYQTETRAILAAHWQNAA
ncbi:MAG: cadherin-like domain-containing protein [Magnetococcales bacterium]|nr:cadherin-like domain-containing protein [Magnetococcales bacterium]